MKGGGESVAKMRFSRNVFGFAPMVSGYGIIYGDAKRSTI